MECRGYDEPRNLTATKAGRFSVPIPLFEHDKDTQLISFDLRDRKGSPLSLRLRSASAQVCLAILMGAIATEHASDSEVAALDAGNPLCAVLVEWFRNVDLPISTRTGKPIAIDDNNGLEEIKIAFDVFARDFCEARGLSSAKEQALVRDFHGYYSNSRIFRYFVMRFAYKWLACCVIENDEDSYSIIKYSYVVSRDVIKGKSVHGRRRLFDGIGYEYELAGVGMAEVSHITVCAPEGLVLAPANPTLAEGEERGVEGGFVIVDDPYPSMVENRDPTTSDLDDPQLEAQGTLTPGYATVRALYPWQSSDGGGASKRVRRLPVEGCNEHRYLMSLNFRPKLGVREVGRLVLSFFSAMVFLMCALNPSMILAEDSLLYGPVVALIPAAITVVTLRDTPSYLRRCAAGPSEPLFAVVVLIDVVAFTAALLLASQAQAAAIGDAVPLGVISVLAWVLFLLDGCASLLQGSWLLVTWASTHRKTEGKATPLKFDVQICSVQD